MTGIAILCHENGIELVSDGAAYDGYTGELGSIATKVVLLPEYSALMTWRGDGRFMPALQCTIAQQFKSFDSLIDGISVACAHTHELLEHDVGEPIAWSLYFGGWSEARERFETYTVSSREKVAVDGTVLSGFGLTPLPDFHCAPQPSDEVLHRLGLIDEEGRYTLQDWHWLPLFLHAQRLSTAESTPEPDSLVKCAVGALIQLTSVSQNISVTRIIMRYDDPLGEVLTPKDDEVARIKAAVDAALGVPAA